MEFPWLMSKFLCMLYLQALFSPNFCFPYDQGLALLQFKKSFGIINKLDSWIEGTDYCSWAGVVCDLDTGHVIGLHLANSKLYGDLVSNNTLFLLDHLQRLDLSHNDFNGSHISYQFSLFLNLKYLNLGYSNFAGQVPSEISLLSKLVFLDLSYNRNLVLQRSSFNGLVQNLTGLRELGLNGVDLSTVAPISLMNLSSSVSSLRLASSRLQGQFPDEIFRRSNLEVLDLWVNQDLTGFFPRFSGSNSSANRLWYLALSSTRISIYLQHDNFGGFKSLKELYLSSCSVMGYNLAFLGNLTQLIRLDLSNNNFSGQIPPSLGNLKHLSFLHLANNHFQGQIPSVVGNLTELHFLSLSNNKLTGMIPSQVSKFPSLNQLDLSSNSLSGAIPQSLFALPSLQNLFLQKNLLFGHISSFQVSPLKYIDLSGNMLDGPIPSSITKLANLSRLFLASNRNLTGDIPSSICELKFLQVLDLSNNKLTGRVPQCIGDSNHGSVEVVNLSNNMLHGPIPGSIFKLMKLKILVLSSNKLVGEIPSSICQLKSVQTLDLSNNSFSGFIPQCFHQDDQLMRPIAARVNILPNLIFLDLSHNLLNGTIPSFMFNLSSLRHLFLGNNFLTGQISQLKSNSVLQVIDFSSNSLQGPIPSSLFGPSSLQYLFLQNNQFTGLISEFHCNALKYLDLSKNILQGPIPSSVSKLVNLSVLILSKNKKLMQGIPSAICDLKSLQILDLSNNSLSGFIPQCLGNFSNSLSVLHLGNNNLQGTLSMSFLERNSLRYLNFNGNQLHGKLPISIINCRYLELLNLGNNRIQDVFPYFLEILTELQVLILGSNKLYGSWRNPATNFSFPKLRILDLSNNLLSGNLPSKYFHCLKAMMKVDKDMEYMMMKDYFYEYTVEVTLKGLEIQLPKIQSKFTIIDLSGNKFTGEIPEAIGGLKSLKQLNLSHNLLTNYIPSSLGNLSNLESLDFSFNALIGEIPVALVDLTFLQVLNLSYNQLQGPIPTGNQFNTFPSSSYQGNSGLCGFPLSKSCSSNTDHQIAPSNLPAKNDSLSEFKFEWRGMVIGFGCGIIFGVSMGFISHRTRRPAWLIRVIETAASGLKIRM